MVVQRADEGANLSEESPNHVAYFRSFVCVGEIFQQRYREALQAGLQARAAALEGRRPRMLARADYCLMRVYRILGNLDLSYQAGRSMIAALALEPAGRTIEFRSFFAHILASLGKRREAVAQLRMVIQEADNLPLPRNFDRFFVPRLESAKADALEQIGLILLRAGDFPPAEECLIQAFRIRRLSDPSKLSWSYNSLGELRMAQGRAAEAAAFWSRSVDNPANGFPIWFPQSYRAKANLALGRPKEALDNLLAALDSVRDLRLHLPLGDQVQVESEVSLQSIFALAVPTAAELGMQDLAFSIAAESRAHSLRARAAANSNWRNRLPARYWKVLAALRTPALNSRHQNYEKLRQELNEMESVAGLAGPSYHFVSVHSKTIARQLHPGDRFTFFYTLDRKSLRFTIENGRLRLDWIASGNAIARASEEFARAVQENRPSHRDLGRRLHQLVFSGYSPLPPGAVWTILPDEEFIQVPWAVLTNPGTNRYLVEETPLRIAAGIAPMGQPAASGRTMFAAFADPVSNRADKRWNEGMRWWSRHLQPRPATEPPLPSLSGSRIEAERCSRAWRLGASRILLGRDLLNANGLPAQAAVFHFATHVLQTDTSRPSSPAIFLGLSDRGNSVLLTEPEIQALSSSPVLVTLSGCGSGTGRFAPGAGMIGLTRAWLMAGANGVLASLWAVPDGSGTLFEDYYKTLQQFDTLDSRNAAIALAKAQNAAIPRSRPSVWAAYFVVGMMDNCES
ncbi:MAG: CHAT domain-containing protein [Acidobacteria bacterium]|nr:CHAT domain-containing protein [Acidobacteriota bacterium]